MKRVINVAVFLFFIGAWSQTDYSNSWEDFYSYNNVKDFVKVDTKIYALVDNAIFIYDTSTNEISKMSSVNGLSGETATSIHYNITFQRLAVGYTNGLLEIVDANGTITIAPDIANFPLATEKSILNITEYNDLLYLSTSFAIVVYDIGNLVFGDTYFIGDQSSEVKVNETIIFNETIYAATENGIYTADINNLSLIDFNNWTKFDTRNFTSIVTFNNEIYVSIARNFYRFILPNGLQFIQRLPSTILKLKASNEFLSIAIKREAYIYDQGLNLVSNIISDDTSDFYFELNAVYAENNTTYLCTKEFGILQTDLMSTQPFVETHPDGPTSNSSFSISVLNDNLWVVYGGYSSSYSPLNNRLGYSHFNGENWINNPYDPNFPAKNLVHATIDPNEENKVYLSSWSQGSGARVVESGGILVIENNEPQVYWNQTNSGLEEIFPDNPNYVTVRINGSAFDREGNLWVANAWIDNMVKKMSPSGAWSSFNISELLTNPARGLNELIIDKTGSIWIGTRRNGALVFNERGEQKRALITEATKGSLPHLNVRTVAVDNSNRIWIGTQAGMVVYYNAAGLFDADIYDAEPVIILDDGIPKKLLGDQVINSISVDGADNKWFGTESGGALQASPNGRETLNIFNTSNSPLPSNTILKIKVDTSTGKVYFATDKGIVAFNNNIAAYGDTLDEVYAYPNPAKKQHEFITIDGRNGTHLPQGTNVKILDSAGYLVYETNVIEGQELQGGKVVWNKTNLAGRKVASGVYIVLLTTKDNEEVSSTKIAIIN
ncbi:MAG: two-component regulator propeller domain-containing protein [Urechidicola sp.]|nr:two-component regulator propeller domain-containing protein [Urechidicola sp.]